MPIHLAKSMMAFLPSFTHGRNPKNAGSAASRGLTRVMDGSEHRDADDACPGSSVHICPVGERIGMSSGVAYAARHPHSTSRTLAKNPDGEVENPRRASSGAVRPRARTARTRRDDTSGR